MEKKDKQSEQTQRGILGKGGFEAWKDGAVSLNQFSAERPDDVYGQMRSVPPLSEMLKSG